MLFQDVRYALRNLSRSKGFATVAILCLGFGIGLNATIFSLIDGVLLRPLPYPAADRLVVLRIFDPQFQDRYSSFPVNAAHIAVWRDHCRGCEDVAAIDATTTTLTGAGEPEQVDAAAVTPNFFAFLGIAPALSRSFSRGEDVIGGPRVAMISYETWQSHHGARPDIIGSTVRFDNKPYEIIGVLPPAFTLLRAIVYA